MKRVKPIILAAVLLGVALSVAAQQASTVFDIEPGVRMLGAGSAGLSVTSGAETLYHNPASLTQLPGISFSSSYTSYFGLANYSAFALTLRNWGVALLLLNSGGIEGFDGQGNPTGNLAYRNTGLLFGVGLDPSTLPFLPRLPFDFSLGLRGKYVSSRIAGVSGSGFGLDLGFRAGLPGLRLGPVGITDTTFAVTLVNLLGSVSHDAESDPFLTELKLGTSARIADVILLAADVHFGGSTHFGVTYSLAPVFELRVGLIAKGGISATFGAGLNLDGFLFDYAYAGHRLGASHRVSLTLDFSSVDMIALRDRMRRILP